MRFAPIASALTDGKSQTAAYVHGIGNNSPGQLQRWEQEGLDVHGTRWVAMYLPVWLYSYHQPGKNGGLLHYIAVNGRTGETMGSIPVQQWKLILVALTVGTFLEGIAIWILATQ